MRKKGIEEMDMSGFDAGPAIARAGHMREKKTSQGEAKRSLRSAFSVKGVRDWKRAIRD